MIKRMLLAAPHVLKHGGNFGRCPICEKHAFFYAEGTWLRDQYRCLRCRSIPRGRALISVLHSHFPDWRALRIHESSPGGPSSDKIARECADYTATQFFPGTPFGESKNGFQCENLEAQTFPDAAFDMVITQDVFEHILHPDRACAEIARTLKPGGVHLFTVPWYYWKPTLIRAVEKNDEIEMLEAADYHGNPIDPDGSLVVTEWGEDFCDTVYQHSGMTTTIVRIKDRSAGIDGKFIEVFISRKPKIDSSVFSQYQTIQEAVGSISMTPSCSGKKNVP